MFDFYDVTTGSGSERVWAPTKSILPKPYLVNHGVHTDLISWC
jgi:hypothetical protein